MVVILKNVNGILQIEATIPLYSRLGVPKNRVIEVPHSVYIGLMPMGIWRGPRQVITQIEQRLEVHNGKMGTFPDIGGITFDRSEVRAYDVIMFIDHLPAFGTTQYPAVADDRAAVAAVEGGDPGPVVVDWAVDVEVSSRGDLRSVVGKVDAWVCVL